MSLIQLREVDNWRLGFGSDSSEAFSFEIFVLAKHHPGLLLREFGKGDPSK
jgi:hypothetical protein